MLSAWHEGRKWVKVALVIKGRRKLYTHVNINHLRMRGLIYKPGERHYAITGWGWEGDEFMVHAEALRWPQAL